MASVQPDEERFKAHIRQLLFRYAKEYLTVDYVEWTEKAVLELLQQYLRDVPVDDPASLWLPQDPFDMLARLYNLSKLTAYEERWQTNSHALALIKESLASHSGKTRSEKAPFFDDYDMRYLERMVPVLTMRAIRDTHTFSSHPKVVATQRTPFFVTEKISELQIGDEGTPLQMERILNVIWGIHSTIRAEVRDLLSETLNLPARDTGSCRCFEDGCDTQPSCIERLEWPFVPLFPRNRRLGCQTIDGAQTGKLDYFAELQKNILPQIPTEKLELDLFSGDMCVFDNWVQISSPSTLATLTSSQEDRKIDLLFIGSSPNTDPYPIETLEAAKMETIQMPRSRRLGGIPEPTKAIMHGHSFTSFILQQLPGTKGPETSDLIPCCLPQEYTSSLAGQAPSSGPHEVLGLLNEDDDRIVRSLYACVDPKDVWHGETLDEKNMVFMEVPTLPPPNNHTPGCLFLPSSFSDFAPAPGGQGVVHKFLRKVKGIQPLQVALSWMAFTTNEPLPTNAQVVGASFFMESELLTKGVPIGAIRELIDGIAPGIEGRQCDMTPMQVDTRLFGNATSPASGRFVDRVADIILTRRERWRQAGEFDTELELATRASEMSGDIFVEPRLENYPRPTKKLKLYQIRETSLDNVSLKSPDSGSAKDKLIDFSSQAVKNTGPVTTNHTAKNSSIIQPSSYSRFVPENASDTSTGPVRLFDSKIITAEIRKPLFNPSTTASHEAKASTYARLRLKTVSTPNISTEDLSGHPNAFIPAEEGTTRSREIPAGVFNHSTLQLPPYIKDTATCHHYMASISVLQKQVLVRTLATPRYSVELVERDDLGSAELIIDPFTCVIYASLFSLPSECEGIISRVSKLSWIYKRLVVVLEGYPPSAAIKASDETSDSLFAYTPPVLKAIKKLRRGVDMTEAVGEKCETTKVLYAFPNTINEAAAITRHIGNLAEDAGPTNGVWGDRMWMNEVTEDEGILAEAAGMNRFTAALILSQVTLEDFVEMTAEQRQDAFGCYVGEEAIAAFNADLKARVEINRSSDKTELQDYYHAIDTHESGTTDEFDVDIYS